jgi:hypothetical protein
MLATRCVPEGSDFRCRWDFRGLTTRAQDSYEIQVYGSETIPPGAGVE